jgi:type IV pilus assembly protein PilE
MRRTKGFTLIELMITVAVVGILGAVAYPSYRSSVQRSNRAEAKAILMDIAAREERFMSDYNTYTTSIFGATGCSGSACGLNYTKVDADGDGKHESENGFYEVTVAAGGAGIGTSFTATATAIGGQSDDTDCATMTLTSTGVKSAKKSNNSANSECW